MTNLIEMLAIPAVAIGAYVFASKHITKYMMNGGKNEKQIINAHINDSNKRYLVKYPEANIQTSKNLLMAFGFIFAFASSIYAFSLIGETGPTLVFDKQEFDETFEIMPPMAEIEEKAVKQEKLIEKVVAEAKIKLVETLPPDIIEDKKPDVVVTKDVVLSTDVIDLPEEKEVVDEGKTFLIVEEMPKFKGCVDLSGEESTICTNSRLQNFAAQLDIPQYIIDNDLGGMVYVKFIVGKKGKIKNVEILRGANKSLDRVVLNHFKNLPDFASAGLQRGKEVNVQYVIPVNVVLN